MSFRQSHPTEIKMLNFDRLTVKAGESIQAAASEARRRGNPEVHGVHLLHALLGQEEGIVTPILQKLGVPMDSVRADTTAAMDRMARVEGGSDPRLSRDLNNALDVAEKESRKLGDEYVSTEHLLLCLTTEKDDAGKVLKKAGATLELVRDALEAVRGPHRVTDQNPEDKFQALARYSRDLTDLARRNKLDPVIGRDEEIRRVVQVLARRTKNNPGSDRRARGGEDGNRRGSGPADRGGRRPRASGGQETALSGHLVACWPGPSTGGSSKSA